MNIDSKELGKAIADVLREHLEVRLDGDERRRKFGEHGAKAYLALWNIRMKVREWAKAGEKLDPADVQLEVWDIINDDAPDFDQVWR